MRTAGNTLLPKSQPWADSAQLHRLAAKKHFVFAPTPLLRWLWSLGLSQTSERLFLVYWEDACSRAAGQYLSARLSVSLAASLIGTSEAAVKKANRQLLEAGVITRSSRQIRSCASTIADTVITIPHEVMLLLWDAPDRAPASTSSHVSEQVSVVDIQPSTPLTPEPNPDPANLQERLDTLRGELRRMNAGKRLRDALVGSDTASAQMDLIRQIDHLERQLSMRAAEPPPPVGVEDPSVEPPAAALTVQAKRPTRSLSPARRQAIVAAVSQIRGISAPRQVLNEIIHQVEQGVFTHIPIPKAVNICLYLVRVGRWRTPYGMKPPKYGVGEERPFRSGNRRRSPTSAAGYLH